MDHRPPYWGHWWKTHTYIYIYMFAIIKWPRDSGSVYHNYSRFFSIVLLAVIDITTSLCGWILGRMGWHRTVLCSVTLFWSQCWKTGPEGLPCDDCPIPYFLIGDDAFPLINGWWSLSLGTISQWMTEYSTNNVLGWDAVRMLSGSDSTASSLLSNSKQPMLTASCWFVFVSITCCRSGIQAFRIQLWIVK